MRLGVKAWPLTLPAPAPAEAQLKQLRKDRAGAQCLLRDVCTGGCGCGLPCTPSPEWAHTAGRNKPFCRERTLAFPILRLDLCLWASELQPGTEKLAMGYQALLSSWAGAPPSFQVHREPRA